jgi:hypothetical protein
VSANLAVRKIVDTTLDFNFLIEVLVSIFPEPLPHISKAFRSGHILSQQIKTTFPPVFCAKEKTRLKLTIIPCQPLHFRDIMARNETEGRYYADHAPVLPQPQPQGFSFPFGWINFLR